MGSAARRHKYNASRAYRCAMCNAARANDTGNCPACGKVGGTETFHSKAEARRWDELILLVRAGKFTVLRRQVEHRLLAWAGGLAKPEPLGKYITDFEYFEPETGAFHYEDVKGFDTPLSKWKRKHFEAQQAVVVDTPGLRSKPARVVRRSLSDQS